MQRRVVIEDRIEGREDGDRRCGGELGRAARLTEKERFVEDAGGDVNRCLSRCMREGPAVIDDESRRIAYGAKIPLRRLSDRPEFEYRTVAAVVFGFDADLLALAFRRSQQGLVFQDGVEIVDAAVESGEADHFVARATCMG